MFRLSVAIAALSLVASAAHAKPRDPFEPLGDDRAGDIDPNPLMAFQLEQLVVTGIVLGATPRAVIEAPDGSCHLARVGDRIGKNASLITRISKRELTLSNTFRDGIGGVHRMNVALTMRERLLMSRAPQ